jgi:XTP/dITP diphosphohydrolase
MKIILASQNKGKMNEVKAIFKGTDFQIFSLYDLGNDMDVEETGNTFYDNALIKAKAVYDIYKEPVFADDSGLAIEQLDGRPGVFSARYAGEGCSFADNNMKVISELWNLPEPHKAKFVSTAIFYDGKNIVEAVGELEGEIIMEQRGAEGFGYDPVFIPDGYNITIAEMSFDEKNKISHRAKSFNKLKEKLMQVFPV